MSADDTAAIRDLNDRCRSTFTGCVVVSTQAVRALTADQQAALLAAIRTFDAFSEDNDPRKEHDFGDIELFDQTWFWKFDYYTPDMTAGSEDPSDPEQTCRVLTILRADEY